MESSIKLPIRMAARPEAAAPVQLNQLLAQMTAGLSQGQELERLLSQFLQPIMDMTHARAGVVRVLAEDGQHFRLISQAGLPEALRQPEQWVDRQCGACGVAANQGDVAWADSLHPCVQHHASQDATEQRFDRMLAVPLRHRDNLLGIYNLFFDANATLDTGVTPVLRSVGELLGLALHSARLERENLRSTVMDERRMLASEVHDGIAQTLVYANMRLPLLQDAIDRSDLVQAQRYVGDVEQALADIHGNLRDIMANFRAPMAAQGLLLGLQDMAHNFSARSGIPLNLECEATDLGLGVPQEVQVFHIVQEALSNVFRHSQATQAWLTVRRTPMGLDIRVRDNGRGLDGSAATRAGHYGLDIMQERAHRVGGQVQIYANEHGGTVVSLTVPCEPATPDHTPKPFVGITPGDSP